MEPIVEVFKTNVKQKSTSNKVVKILQHHFPGYRINFDLNDCDKILRIEGNFLNTRDIESIMHDLGYKCEALQ